MIDTGQGLISRLRGRRILIVGDVMLDKYILGEARRISPEAPIPILEVAGENLRLGGAANTAANIIALGSTAVLAGIVGNDASGSALSDLLGLSCISTEHLVVCSDRPTTVKTRIVAQNKQIARFDVETRKRIDEHTETRLLSELDTAMDFCDACIISDYGKGVVTDLLASSVIRWARQRSIPVVVDPKGRDYSKYRGATLLTPNTTETEAALSQQIDTELELLNAGRRMAQAIGCDVLITRGASGMSLFHKGSHTYFPAIAQHVNDVTGAGDTVVAVLALALASGLTLPEATYLANIAAGVVVTKLGTSVVSAEELMMIGPILPTTHLGGLIPDRSVDETIIA